MNSVHRTIPKTSYFSSFTMNVPTDNIPALAILLAAAAADTDTTKILNSIVLRQHRRRKALQVLLCGPTRILKDYQQKRKIPYKRFCWSIENQSDDWCIEFLRFNKSQLIELAKLLEIPGTFRY